jgi:cellulose synthase/poly-beta-1,6-N-acetylglucosamine synthase-like glycosyltransferase
MNHSKTLPDVSVVLAVRNVEDEVAGHVRRVVAHLRQFGRPFEVVAVNAGSWDTSFKVLHLLASELPELRLIEKDLTGRAFIRGAAEAHGQTVVLMDADQMPSSLAPLGWTLSRLSAGKEAVVVRGRFIAARRLPALPAIARARGRGDAFARSFEREGQGLALEVVGTARKAPSGLFAPVWRLLVA